MSISAAERYVRLGLALDRHVEGTVDAYFGPPEWKAEADAGEPVDPAVLAAAADKLLDELDDGWLHDQTVGLRAFAGVLAGESRSYADEVEACYRVFPSWTDEPVFEAAHEQLEELLPGDGPLGDRYQAWRDSTVVPTEIVEQTVAAAIEEARAHAQRLAELPDGEGIDLEIVRDEPWLAFNYYQGDLRSRIAVNVDLPLPAVELLHLAIHEAYPGHHAERCLKEEGLVRRRGLVEEAIVLVPTPASLVSEGIAELGSYLLLEGEAGAALAAVVREAGIEFDLAHAVAIERARDPLGWAAVNAALMLHERGATDDETRDYLGRWGLMTPELASHLIRFCREPTSRTYVITYAAGRELCEAWVGGKVERFRRLLTEQVRVAELRETAA